MENFLNTPNGIIIVRAAITEDAPALRELRLEALDSQPEVFAADHTAAAADPPAVWADLITKNSREQRGIICIASSAGRLVGMTGLGRGHWPKTRHSAMIWGVYVNAAWRGFHLAEALIAECITWAKAQEIKVVKLGVVTTNTFAIRCYARCGFTVYGVEPQAIYCNEVFYDELLMTKFI